MSYSLPCLRAQADCGGQHTHSRGQGVLTRGTRATRLALSLYPLNWHRRGWSYHRFGGHDLLSDGRSVLPIASDARGSHNSSPLPETGRTAIGMGTRYHPESGGKRSVYKWRVSPKLTDSPPTLTHAQSLSAANTARFASGPATRPRRSAHATDGLTVLPGSPNIAPGSTVAQPTERAQVVRPDQVAQSRNRLVGRR
jgi:hypothetical protein